MIFLPLLIFSFLSILFRPKSQNSRFSYSPTIPQFENCRMLRTTIQRQVRLATPVKATMIPSRSYTDKFQERETASENQYIRKREAEQLKAMEAQLAKAKEQVSELQAKIDKHIESKDAATKN